MFKTFLAASTAMTLALAGPAHAQSATSNIIFMMDESGSMSGEQDFLTQFVLDLDAALAVGGFGSRNYGLMGFAAGSTNPGLIREFSIGGSQLGNATDLSAATTNLTTPGGTEDGYAAIDYVLKNYTIPAGNTTLVLITDEDRDDTTGGSLLFADVLSAIQTAGANLVAMVDIGILDANNDTAISTDGTTTLVQTGTTFTSTAHGSFTGGFGTTEADYADLALATNGGCVADLNQLRLGGDAAAAFALAFQTCVINAATDGGIKFILTTDIFRNSSMTVAQNIRAQIRILALVKSYIGTGGFYSTQGNAIVNDMLGIEGLRGYAFATASSGSASGGTDLSGKGLTIGADYTFQTQQYLFRTGIAFSGLNSSSDASGFDSDSDTKTANIYGLYQAASGMQLYGDITAGRTDHDYTMLFPTGTASGSTESDYRAASLELGQRFALGGNAANILMPYVGVSREMLEVDSFTASNGAIVPGYDQTTTFGKLGVRWEKTTPVSFGALHTDVDFSWNRVMNEDIDVNSGGTVTATPGSTDDDRFDLALNFGLDTKAGGRVIMTLAGSKSENVRMGTVGLGYEMKF